MTAYIFDTETTGKNDPEIIEAAWLRLGKGRSIEGRYESRFNPSIPVEYGAMAVHHITNDDLLEWPDSSEFKIPEDMTYMIGHNVDYDWNMAGCPNVYRICTLALSRYLWPECDSHTQSALLYYLAEDKISMRDNLKYAHSAMIDCENNLILLNKIIEKLGTNSWIDLYIKSEEARIPTVISFGKHKGTYISSLPKDYIQWLLKQPDLDVYLQQALNNAIA